MTIGDENNQVNEVLENRLSQLNAAIEAHEAALKAMMVPLPVAVPAGEKEPEEWEQWQEGHRLVEYCALGMIKWQGTWRLCYAAGYAAADQFSEEPNEQDWKPLVDSSIEDRVRAIPYIDKLREEIVATKKSLIPTLESAIETLARSLEGYQPPPKKKKK